MRRAKMCVNWYTLTFVNSMENQAASIDECVHLLGQDVLDLLSLRGVISKLSTNWRQLKQSLREKGLLRDNQSAVDWRGSTPPSQTVSTDTPSVDNLQESTPPAVSAENVSQLVVGLVYRDLPLQGSLLKQAPNQGMIFGDLPSDNRY
jgi:hypothetical protein